MKDYTLLKEKIAGVEKFHCSLLDKRQADRVKAVIALSKGWSVTQVAENLLLDKKTSRHYFNRACESFYRKWEKYLPELQMRLTVNFHIQAA